MLRVIAVDDEPLALGQLEKYIAKVREMRDSAHGALWGI